MDSRRLRCAGLGRDVGAAISAERSNLRPTTDERVITITPFERRVAGVTLKLWRNPYTKVAVMERSGPDIDPIKEVAVRTVADWMTDQLRRFLGAEWTVIRGEGW